VLRVVSRSDATDRAGDTPQTAGMPRAADTLRSEGRNEAPAANPGAPGEAGAAAPGGRVLVVEDSPTVSSVVKYFLELEGFEVLLAGDGLVGLEVALRERPDVIVSDVNMPGMGGVAMVKALRGDARTSQVRIVMLTSESSVESEAEGLAAGADDYILKPVEPRRLAARVKALLARSRPTAA
jgi:two-component system alkaline phosphatase synthesis response regulator PhoP